VQFGSEPAAHPPLYGLSDAAMTTLSNRYAIAGTGKSNLGRTGLSALTLLEQAMRRAVDDAGLKMTDIDGIISHGTEDSYTHHQMIGSRLGINSRFSTSLDNGGASQILAVTLAVMAIDAGMASTVLCGFGRDTWGRTVQKDGTRTSAVSSRAPAEFTAEYGYFGAVATHGFGARRHMFEYGTTREQFASVALAFREHALRNPDAVMKKPLTLDDYLSARLIVDPYCLYDCSLVSDGAGAVVVMSAERAKSLRQPPVLIKGFGSFNNLTGWFEGSNMLNTGAVESGKAAFRMAGIGPKDVDTAQIYDCFTGMVIVQLEDYGFCKKGEGGAFVQSGALRLDGVLPTNTSGGQLSEAHVEGMLQIVEGVRQLRHTYPAERQVRDAEIALISGHGGNTVCHSSLILERAS
jgi:acetyl-CoA acetyltransferase